MVNETDGLIFFGSSGDEMTVSHPDSDGNVEFEIYSDHYDVAAGAYLDAAERRKLIEHLQRCTPHDT